MKKSRIEKRIEQAKIKLDELLENHDRNSYEVYRQSLIVDILINILYKKQGVNI
jgi:hypothetical protein